MLSLSWRDKRTTRLNQQWPNQTPCRGATVLSRERLPFWRRSFSLVNQKLTMNTIDYLETHRKHNTSTRTNSTLREPGWNSRSLSSKFCQSIQCCGRKDRKADGEVLECSGVPDEWRERLDGWHELNLRFVCYQDALNPSSASLGFGCWRNFWCRSDVDEGTRRRVWLLSIA